MSFTTDERPGITLLGHAVGHAAALYGDQVDDYGDILSAAIRGRHRAPGATLSDYATSRARQLIAQADSLGADRMAMAGWIGSATAVLAELTRDA